jgi:hypothetical protein
VKSRAHRARYAKQFGFKNSNVQFLDGYIERRDDLGLKPGSVGAIVCNCVINLSTDTLALLKGAYELLKRRRRDALCRCLYRPDQRRCWFDPSGPERDLADP